MAPASRKLLPPNHGTTDDAQETDVEYEQDNDQEEEEEDSNGEIIEEVPRHGAPNHPTVVHQNASNQIIFLVDASPPINTQVGDEEAITNICARLDRIEESERRRDRAVEAILNDIAAVNTNRREDRERHAQAIHATLERVVRLEIDRLVAHQQLKNVQRQVHRQARMNPPQPPPELPRLDNLSLNSGSLAPDNVDLTVPVDPPDNTYGLTHQSNSIDQLGDNSRNILHRRTDVDDEGHPRQQGEFSGRVILSELEYEQFQQSFQFLKEYHEALPSLQEKLELMEKRNPQELLQQSFKVLEKHRQTLQSLQQDVKAIEKRIPQQDEASDYVTLGKQDYKPLQHFLQELPSLRQRLEAVEKPTPGDEADERLMLSKQEYEQLRQFPQDLLLLKQKLEAIEKRIPQDEAEKGVTISKQEYEQIQRCLEAGPWLHERLMAVEERILRHDDKQDIDRMEADSQIPDISTMVSQALEIYTQGLESALRAHLDGEFERLRREVDETIRNAEHRFESTASNRPEAPLPTEDLLREIRQLVSQQCQSHLEECFKDFSPNPCNTQNQATAAPLPTEDLMQEIRRVVSQQCQNHLDRFSKDSPHYPNNPQIQAITAPQRPPSPPKIPPRCGADTRTASDPKAGIHISVKACGDRRSNRDGKRSRPREPSAAPTEARDPKRKLLPNAKRATLQQDRADGEHRAFRSQYLKFCAVNHDPGESWCGETAQLEPGETEDSGVWYCHEHRFLQQQRQPRTANSIGRHHERFRTRS